MSFAHNLHRVGVLVVVVASLCVLLVVVDCCWLSLVRVCCWWLLVVVCCCWFLLVVVGCRWLLLVAIGLPPGPFRVFQDWGGSPSLEAPDSCLGWVVA